LTFAFFGIELFHAAKSLDVVLTMAAMINIRETGESVASFVNEKVDFFLYAFI
jgi:hypothetical protein